MSLGPVVDVHLHGAFGFDLMAPAARFQEFEAFCARLYSAGIVAFCPTTLSEDWGPLLAAIGRVGKWTRAAWSAAGFDPRAARWRPGRGWKGRALPLGLHLEGPFLAPDACGAHPARALRQLLSTRDLEDLWRTSNETILKMTVAPEAVPVEVREPLWAWARAHRVALSVGHTRCSAAVAREWLDGGVMNLTHAWNAMGFHHREPGPVGAWLAAGGASSGAAPRAWMELIVDGVHVAPEVLRMTRAASDGVCAVSDCTPAAGTAAGAISTMGDLRVMVGADGASHVGSPGGPLAGGGMLLAEFAARAASWGWSAREIARWRAAVGENPLRSLGLAPAVVRGVLTR